MLFFFGGGGVVKSRDESIFFVMAILLRASLILNEYSRCVFAQKKLKIKRSCVLHLSSFLASMKFWPVFFTLLPAANGE